MEHLKEIAFVVYPVREPQTAKKFYAEVLGLKESANWQDQWIEFDIGSGTLAITNGFTQIQAGAKGAMAAMEVDDLDQVLAQLKPQSVPLVGDPWDTPVCRGAIIADPDGNMILLHQKK